MVLTFEPQQRILQLACWQLRVERSTAPRTWKHQAISNIKVDLCQDARVWVGNFSQSLLVELGLVQLQHNTFIRGTTWRRSSIITSGFPGTISKCAYDGITNWNLQWVKSQRLSREIYTHTLLLISPVILGSGISFLRLPLKREFNRSWTIPEACISNWRRTIIQKPSLLQGM